MCAEGTAVGDARETVSTDRRDGTGEKIRSNRKAKASQGAGGEETRFVTTGASRPVTAGLRMATRSGTRREATETEEGSLCHNRRTESKCSLARWA